MWYYPHSPMTTAGLPPQPDRGSPPPVYGYAGGADAALRELADLLDLSEDAEALRKVSGMAGALGVRRSDTPRRIHDQIQVGKKRSSL